MPIALSKELGNLKENSARLTSIWQKEKEGIEGLQHLKEALEEKRQEEEVAERQGDFDKVAQLRHGMIPDLQRRIDALAEQESGSKNNRLLREEVTEEDIAGVVSRWTGIPVSRMLEGERAKLLKMEQRLARRVVGQEDALSAVSRAVRRARAGLQDPNRPIGSFMLLGPTGVGKTELTKALAAFLFDDEQAMVRLDMSEYMEKHAVSRLVGAPPGYVGYEEGGQLTEAVRRRPYSVVLLDEIEKAHPEVFNILLQVLDDGRLTDGQGRVVDFRNTVVVMTSNIGSRHLDAEIEDHERMENRVFEDLKNHFRPEFLNRVDEVVIFHHLSRSQMHDIVAIQLERLREMLVDRKLTLKIGKKATQLLADWGYDPAYGARLLKRVIQRKVQDPLAEALLSGSFMEGDEIVVDANEDGTELVLKNNRK
ncbi:MAG: AAA family ATPase [Magnetococcales bacterium]|nr:AAA family ATPase [Magnetococcales bacterium]